MSNRMWTAEALMAEARRVNTRTFIDGDPVQFPRRYDSLRDAEVATLLTATIAWGRRTMILRDAERLFALLGPHPSEPLPIPEGLRECNVHRTLFMPNVMRYARAFLYIYAREDSLNAWFRRHGAGSAWDVARLLHEAIVAANGEGDPLLVPRGYESSALKRINLALRWMVRRDGIVDMGLWDFISPAELYIPLDVHSARVARAIGLLRRKSNDRKAAEELTAACRDICPHDPALLDFALFGLGVENKL